MKFEQQILDLEPFEIQTSSGYNQYPASGYYNQPYQGYSNLPNNPQPVQGYNYTGMGGAVGNVPVNAQYAPNVRWNENPTYANTYKRP